MGTSMVPRLEEYQWPYIRRRLNNLPMLFYETDDDLFMIPDSDRLKNLFFHWMTSQVRAYQRRIVRLNRRHWGNSYDSDATELSLSD